MYHTAIRLSPFLEVITHSATVNHGGGLRKSREHVYANPCHYAQTAFAALSGATVLPVEIASCTETTPRVLPDLSNAVKDQLNYSAIDAIAARNQDGIWLYIVNRKTAPVNLTVELAGFTATDAAEVQSLTAELPWSSNSLQDPDEIKPINSKVTLQQGKLQLSLAPYTVVRVRLPQQH
jgi:alpha-N-arabinofuranosidase